MQFFLKGYSPCFQDLLVNINYFLATLFPNTQEVEFPSKFKIIKT